MTSRHKELAFQVERVGLDLGLSHGSYQLIRHGTNIVFANEKSEVVARVAPDYIEFNEVADKLADCQELVAAGAPILVPLINEVVTLPAGNLVSFWPLAQAGPPPNGREMAQTLAACHRLAAPDRLSDWSPDLYANRRLATLKIGIEAGLPTDIASNLTALFTKALANLKNVWGELESKTDVGFIHGDTHHSNFVRYEGQVVMCDPDNICRGPKEKDLANIWECCRRQYINPSYWEQFTNNYPLDYNQNLIDVLARVQGISGCMWATQFWASRPEYRQGVRHALATIDQPNAKWVDF